MPGLSTISLRRFALDPIQSALAGLVAVALLGGLLFSALLGNLRILGLVLAGSAGLLLIAHPRWIWLLLLTLLPFSVEVKNLLGAGHNLVVPTEVLTPLALGAAMLMVIRNGCLKWSTSPLHIAVGLYIAVQCLSLLTTQVPVVTLKALIRNLSAFMGGYVLTQMCVQSFEDLKWPFRLLAGSFVLITLYGLYTQFSEGIAIYQEIAAPFIGDHCIYAAFLSFPAAFLLSAVTQPVRQRWWALGLLGLFAIAILASFVRGAWLGFLILMFYLLIHQRAALSFRYALILSLTVLIGLGGVLAFGLQALIQERWETLFDIRYVANESRIDRWMAAISMWVSSPFYGVGLGCYPDLHYQHVYYARSFEAEQHMGAHNLYLEILAELGIIGLFAFQLLIVAFLIETRRIYRLGVDSPEIRAFSLGLEGMMLVYLVHVLVNNLGPSDKIDICFWTLCGLAPSVRCGLQWLLIQNKQKGASP